MNSATLTKCQFGSALLEELPVLLRVANRLTPDSETAEDLVSQTVFKALRSQDSFDGGFFRSWLIRILKNEFAMALRTQKARPKTISIEQILIQPSENGDMIHETERKLDLNAALDVLPEEYRLPVALCDIEELSYEEAAESLEMPIGTLRSRLHRGRRLLRQIIMRGEQ